MPMRWSLPLAFTLTLAACANAPQSSAPEPAAAPVAAAPASPVLDSGLFLQNFDKSVRAQDDFYRFVNGTWLARTEIPADKNNYGSFGILQDESEKNLHAIAEEAARPRAATRS
jgi:putative endopeptidase